MWGRFLRQLMGRGMKEAPLASLDNIAVLSDGRLLVLEAQSGTPAKMHILDADGKLLETRVPPKATIVRSCSFDPKDRYVAGTWIAASTPRTTSVTSGLMNPALEPVVTLSAFEEDFDPLRLKEPDYFLDLMVRLVERVYAPQVWMTYDGDGRLFYAVSDTYEITRTSGDTTDVAWKARRTYEPIPLDGAHVANSALPIVETFRGMPEMEKMITPEFIGTMLGKAKLPKHKPALFGLVPTGDGGVLAVHDLNLQTGEQTADIFNAAGVFLGSVTLPDQAFMSGSDEVNMVFRGGFAYTVARDRQKHNTVVRYRTSLVPAN